MLGIEAILFDKDGTLVDFKATWGPTYQTAAVAMFGGDRTLIERVLKAGGLEDDGRFKPNSLLAASSYREIAEDWASHAPGHTAETALVLLTPLFEAGAVANAKPIVDLATLFKDLRQMGFRLGIATNDTEGSAKRTAARLIGADAVDFVAGCDSGHGGKPEPGMLLAFADAVSVPAGAVAMVGDNVHDLEMGRRGGAGLRIGVLSGSSGKPDLDPHADHVIGDIGELPALLGAKR